MKREVPTSSSSPSISSPLFSSDFTATPRIADGTESETRDSPAKSIASIDSDEMIAATNEAELDEAELNEDKDHTDGNDDEWAKPLKKLNKDFDALASIVNGCSNSNEEEDPQGFSIMVEKGLKNLTSTVTFSRALQQSGRGEGTNNAIELKNAFVSAKGIVEEDRRLYKDEKKLSEEHQELSEEYQKLSEQHQELSEQHQELSEQHQKLSEELEKRQQRNQSENELQDDLGQSDLQRSLAQMNKQLDIANTKTDIANTKTDIANTKTDIANKNNQIKDIRIREKDIRIREGEIQIKKRDIQIKKRDFQLINREIQIMISSLQKSLAPKYKDIAYHLRNMSNLSQSDPVTVPSYSFTEDSVINEMVEKEFIMGEWNFFEEAKSVETAPSEFKHITKVDRLDSKLNEELKKINTKFQDYVSSATLLTKKEGGIKGFVNTFEKFLQSSSEVATYNHGEQTYYPGIEAEEVACVQPFLKGLLCALGNMAAEADWDTKHQSSSEFSPTNSSPTKSNVLSNRIISSTDKRRRRIVDKSLSTHNRYIFLFRDDCIEIPVEVKPGKRAKMTSTDLLKECKNQILGHLAKHVSVGFNFMEIGIDTKATGVVITPCCVEFVQLCLENIGTPAARLAIYETGPLPLLSLDNFLKWKGKEISSTAKENVPTQKKKAKIETAYTAFGYDKAVTATDVPLGLVALANLMTMERKDLMGHSAQFELKEKKADLHLLAWGSFSLIYKCQAQDQEEPCVKKISRYAFKKVLDNEKKVLQELRDVSHVVTLQDTDHVNIKIGTVFEKVPSLTLTPLGLKIEIYLLNVKNNGTFDLSKRIKDMGAKLRTALASIHEKKYVHNDISPKNIIVHKDEPYLIDFGIASRTDRQIKGFRGTPHFTAKTIFMKYPGKSWTSKSHFDFCAFALSMAWLAGQIKEENKTWNSFQPCNVNDSKYKDNKQSLNDWTDTRYEIAKANFDCLSDDFEDWINDMKH